MQFFAHVMRVSRHIPIIVGHRGSPRRAPENTLDSIRMAVAEGATAVEVDLCRTRDGRIVLWHDPSPNTRRALARQAGFARHFAVPEVPSLGSRQRRPVGELSLAEMRRTHGYHRSGGLLSEILGSRHGRRIPFETLEDLLQAIPRLPALQHIYLDLKLDPGLAPEAFRLTARLSRFASQDGGAVTFHLLSPEREVVEVLREATLRGPASVVAYVHCTRSGALARARELSVRHVSLGHNGRSWNNFRAELVGVLEARDRGALDSVAVWTFNAPRRLEELMALGPDAVVTDDIPLARRALQPAPREVEELAGAVASHGLGVLSAG